MYFQKPKTQSDKNAMQHAIKKKLFSQNKIQMKQRRPIDPMKKTVKELLREKREDINYPPELDKEGKLLILNKEHFRTWSFAEHLEKDSLKENKKPMSITSVTDAVESVVKQAVEETYDNNQNTHILDINSKPTEVPSNKFGK